MSNRMTHLRFNDRDMVGLTLDLNDNGDGISFNVSFRTDGGAVAATMHVLVDDSELDRLEQAIRDIRSTRRPA